MMVFKSNEPIKEDAVASLEDELGFLLPSDYRAFLLTKNGGVFSTYAECQVETIGSVMCDVLFGVNVTRSLDLLFWYREMRSEIPENSLLVGTDPSGGFFLLCCSRELAGIYYYDHSYDLPTSSDDGNTYLVSKSFGTWFQQLT